MRWALRPFRGILGTLKGTYRVSSRYIRIPGLRAQLGTHSFNLIYGLGFKGL